MVKQIERNDAIYTDIIDEFDEFNNDIAQFEQSVRGISESSTGQETTDGIKWRYTKNDRRISKKPRFFSK